MVSSGVFAGLDDGCPMTFPLFLALAADASAEVRGELERGPGGAHEPHHLPARIGDRIVDARAPEDIDLRGRTVLEGLDGRRIVRSVAGTTISWVVR